MAQFDLLRPTDQPPGKRRLLRDLDAVLQDATYSDLRWVVAYAKSGPLLRLEARLRAWKAAKKASAVIFGIDQRGTSSEALQLALELFDTVYTTQEAGLTFHPKIYYFRGPDTAEAFVGSNNLTVGGTEKNFEAAVHLRLDVAADAAGIAELEAAWADLLPGACLATEALDAASLADLIADGSVVSEATLTWGGSTGDNATVGKTARGRRSGMLIMPESPLPVSARRRTAPATRQPGAGGALAAAGAAPAVPALGPTPPAGQVVGTVRGLAIQVRAHGNGEIFLSVIAARQNPAFFKWPFTGRTVPKKPGNPSYPQLDPDPTVNISVFDAGPAPVLTLPRYALNTVYYERNSEIRVTASPLVGVVPEYSVMILEVSADPKVDYEITIYTPASPSHALWVAACNQSMPGGGRVPRKFGWF